MVLLQIGALDITPFIVLNTYAVSTQSEYVQWYDGEGTDRRGVKRRKLTGSFTVHFMSPSDYSSFITAVESAKDPDYADAISATVYNNKTRTTSTTRVYLDYDPPNVEPSAGYSFTEEFEINLSER